VKRWVDRYLAGEPMHDRSSRPKSSPNKTNQSTATAFSRAGLTGHPILRWCSPLVRPVVSRQGSLYESAGRPGCFGDYDEVHAHQDRLRHLMTAAA
jgi:hypothetical protein